MTLQNLLQNSTFPRSIHIPSQWMVEGLGGLCQELSEVEIQRPQFIGFFFALRELTVSARKAYTGYTCFFLTSFLKTLERWRHSR